MAPAGPLGCAPPGCPLDGWPLDDWPFDGWLFAVWLLGGCAQGGRSDLSCAELLAAPAKTAREMPIAPRMGGTRGFIL